MEHILKISDFTIYPGGRFIKEGRHSGELYRETIFNTAVASGEPVIIDLTGLEILLPSFVDEAFGPYCQKIGENAFRKQVRFIYPHADSEAEFFVEQTIERRTKKKR